MTAKRPVAVGCGADKWMWPLIAYTENAAWSTYSSPSRQSDDSSGPEETLRKRHQQQQRPQWTHLEPHDLRRVIYGEVDLYAAISQERPLSRRKAEVFEDGRLVDESLGGECRCEGEGAVEGGVRGGGANVMVGVKHDSAKDSTPK